ncbi:MAG: AAA family ATPase [Deinococcota bacterium]
MLLTSLSQLNYRNLQTSHVRFAEGVTAVVGANAAGKSNVLEAIYLSCTGEVPSSTIAESITIGQTGGSVQAQIEHAEGKSQVQIGLSPGHKVIRLDGQVVRAFELAKVTSAVLITPEDANLVHGSPSGRRAYLDSLLSRVSPRYAVLLKEYGRVLEQRNALLKHQPSSATLEVWSSRFIELGDEINALRRRAVGRIGSLATARYADIIGTDVIGTDVMSADIDGAASTGSNDVSAGSNDINTNIINLNKTKAHVENVVDHVDVLVNAGTSARVQTQLNAPHNQDVHTRQDTHTASQLVSPQLTQEKFTTSQTQPSNGHKRLNVELLGAPESLAEALADSYAKERARGVTVVGPHRDDLELTLAGHSVQAYGSRGEARTTALALRIAEYELLRDKHGEAPILLLDDFSAELDMSRRDYLLRLALSTPQAIVSGTEAPPHYQHQLKITAGKICDAGETCG